MIEVEGKSWADKAWVVTRDGRDLGVFGVVVQSLTPPACYMYLEPTELTPNDARAMKRVLHETMHGWLVTAYAEEGTASRFLEFLGLREERAGELTEYKVYKEQF